MHPDPRGADEPYYECPACGLRVEREDVTTCPECGEQVRNIAVTRE
jgi:rRNA maturation endonuclease Nob1